jgi:hypothetical protein
MKILINSIFINDIKSRVYALKYAAYCLFYEIIIAILKDIVF